MEKDRSKGLSLRKKRGKDGKSTKPIIGPPRYLHLSILTSPASISTSPSKPPLMPISDRSPCLPCLAQSSIPPPLPCRSGRATRRK